jgi:preprotein translocase subunit SecF
VELFRGVNIDWLRLKWAFLGFSLLFSVAGIVQDGGPVVDHRKPGSAGVDFRGGTEVQVQFQKAPDIDAIRQAMDAAGIRDAKIQPYNTTAGSNQVLISLPEEHNEGALDAGRQQVVSALHAHYSNPSTIPAPRWMWWARRWASSLETQAGGRLVSLLGMLVYLWFRFQLIYGVAAVVAVFHDTLITVGFFALTGQEISLTVIAAILTLVGYSMNDTIVVFDRIRENLRLSRRESLPDVVNRSINQTLSRTVLTSGLTFLTVLSLYIFGGQVLRGFSFALVVGILIGTYSSIAVAAPMLVAWQQWRASKGKVVVLPAAKRPRA